MKTSFVAFALSNRLEKAFTAPIPHILKPSRTDLAVSHSHNLDVVSTTKRGSTVLAVSMMTLILDLDNEFVSYMLDFELLRPVLMKTPMSFHAFSVRYPVSLREDVSLNRLSCRITLS